jgi:ssDNA-binding Zn-finger/Zn-ribbon topoisomerase 1
MVAIPTCPECGSALTEIPSKSGGFWWPCSEYPKTKCGGRRYDLTEEEKTTLRSNKKYYNREIANILRDLGKDPNDQGFIQVEQGDRAKTWRSYPTVNGMMIEYWNNHYQEGCSDCGSPLKKNDPRRQIHHINECTTVEEYMIINKDTVKMLCGRACHLKYHFKPLQDVDLDTLKALCEKYPRA